MRSCIYHPTFSWGPWKSKKLVHHETVGAFFPTAMLAPDLPLILDPTTDSIPDRGITAQYRTQATPTPGTPLRLLSAPAVVTEVHPAPYQERERASANHQCVFNMGPERSRGAVFCFSFPDPPGIDSLLMTSVRPEHFGVWMRGIPRLAKHETPQQESLNHVNLHHFANLAARPIPTPAMEPT
jgi:hypothetical protein